MGRGKTKTLQASIAATVVALSATVAYAQTPQTPNSPITVDLSFGTKLGYDTNPNLGGGSASSELSLSEDLSFRFLNETQNQKLQLSGDAAFSITSASGGGTSSSFNSPKVRLNYSRDAANSDLKLNASYWSGDVTSSFDADPTGATFIVVDTGELEKVDYGLTFNWGLNAPLGFSLSSRYAGRFYEGTTDPALFDSTTATVSASANFRFSPVTTGSFTSTAVDYDSQDIFGTNSVTTDFAFQVNHDLARGLSLAGTAGYREKETAASGTVTLDSGFFGGVDAVQTVNNGTYFGGVQFDDSDTAFATALTLGRSIDLPDGAISASVTADKVSGASTQILGNASYLKQLPDGSLTVDFSQSLTENFLSQDIRLSTVGIAYQKALNSDSDLNLSFNFARTEDGGAGSAATQDRSTLSASYSRALTPDWDLSVGYAHRQKSGSATSSANSDSIFLTLTRDLQFGF